MRRVLSVAYRVNCLWVHMTNRHIISVAYDDIWRSDAREHFLDLPTNSTCK